VLPPAASHAAARESVKPGFKLGTDKLRMTMKDRGGTKRAGTQRSGKVAVAVCSFTREVVRRPVGASGTRLTCGSGASTCKMKGGRDAASFTSGKYSYRGSHWVAGTFKLLNDFEEAEDYCYALYAEGWAEHV
jgi:hypothetical protein